MQRFKKLALAVGTALVLTSMPACASILITVQSVIATAGSTGNAFDVSLTNTGPSAVDIGAFNFHVSTISPSILLNGATFATTATYIFTGQSFDQNFAFPLNTSAPGASLDASDLSDPAASVSVGAGAVVGLGHVLFDVAANATPGPVTVTLAGFPSTSVAGPTGANIAFTGSNGTITLNAISSVPEPSTVLLLTGGFAFFGARRYTRKGRREI